MRIDINKLDADLFLKPDLVSGTGRECLRCLGDE